VTTSSKSLPENEWLAFCLSLTNVLERDRPVLFAACEAALSALPAVHKVSSVPTYSTYSEARYGLHLKVLQLCLVSLAIHQRAVVVPRQARDFLTLLWAQVLREEFSEGNALAERLAKEPGGTPRRLLVLFSEVASGIAGAPDASCSMLLVLTLGQRYIEHVGRIVDAVLAGEVAPPFSSAGPPKGSGNPFFDRAFLDYVAGLKDRIP
jgi:hypothetical protein